MAREHTVTLWVNLCVSKSERSASDDRQVTRNAVPARECEHRILRTQVPLPRRPADRLRMQLPCPLLAAPQCSARLPASNGASNGALMVLSGTTLLMLANRRGATAREGGWANQRRAGSMRRHGCSAQCEAAPEEAHRGRRRRAGSCEQRNAAKSDRNPDAGTSVQHHRER